MNKQTKLFLYPLAKPSQDKSLEDDLVRTLRFRYTRRNNTKDNASKIKKHEAYDKQYIKASNANCLRLNFTAEYAKTKN